MPTSRGWSTATAGAPVPTRRGWRAHFRPTTSCSHRARQQPPRTLPMLMSGHLRGRWIEVRLSRRRRVADVGEVDVRRGWIRSGVVVVRLWAPGRSAGIGTGTWSAPASSSRRTAHPSPPCARRSDCSRRTVPAKPRGSRFAAPSRCRACPVSGLTAPAARHPEHRVQRIVYWSCEG